MRIINFDLQTHIEFATKANNYFHSQSQHHSFRSGTWEKPGNLLAVRGELPNTVTIFTLTLDFEPIRVINIQIEGL